MRKTDLLLLLLLVSAAALGRPGETSAPAPEPPRGVEILTGRPDAGIALLPSSRVTVGPGVWRGVLDVAAARPAATRPGKEKGVFVLADPTADPVLVAATAPGFAPRILTPRVLAHGDSLDLTLSPATAMVGRVTDPDEKPVKDARVLVLEEPPPGGTGPGQPTLLGFTTRTDEKGDFRVDGLTAGPFLVIAEAGSRGTVLLRGRWPSGTDRLDLRLPRPGVLGGTIRVEPEGRALPKARVLLTPLADNPYRRSREAVTDEKGGWRIDGLPEAGFEMTVEAEGHLFLEPVRAVPRAGEDRLDLDATLRPFGGLEGRTVDVVTQPVVGAEVFVAYPRRDRNHPVPDPDRPVAITGEKGAFRIDGLPPETGLRVTVRAKDMATRTFVDVAVSSGDPVALPPIVLRPGAKVVGVVTAAESPETPLAGVRVLAVPVDEDARAALARSGPSRHRSATTDEKGAFLVKGLAAGSYRLAASRAGRLAAVTEPFAVEGPEGDPIRIAISLPAGRGVSGVVIGPDGAFVVGARVAASRADGGGATRHATTAADGTFRLTEMAEDVYRLTISARGFAPAARSGVVPERPVRIVLGRPGSIQGRIVPERDGATVPPFAVTLSRRVETERNLPEGEAYEPVVRLRFRAEDGAFVAPGLPPGFYRIEAVLAGGRTGGTEGVRVVAGSATTGVLVRTQASGSLAGRVVSRVTGRGVEGARVGLHAPGAREARTTALTDADGEFRLADVPAGPVTLEVRARDLATVRREGIRALAGLPVRVDDIELTRGSEIRVAVRSAFGGPMAGSRFRLEAIATGRAWNETTDENGIARFDLLRAGAYRLWREGDPASVSAWIVRIGADETREIRLDPSAVVRVEGEISRNGEPVAGVRVELLRVDTSRGHRRVQRTTTDEAGEYALVDVEPGDHLVRLRPRGGATRLIPVLIPAAPVARVDLVLPEEGMIVETVAELDGSVVGDVTVIVRRRGSPLDRGLVEALSGEIARGETDGRGRLVLDGVAPGSYRIEAFRSGFARGLADVNVEAGNGTVEIQVPLPVAGRLVGEVLDLRQHPIPGAFVIVRDAAGRPVTLRERIPVGADGRFRIEGLATGSYLVQAEAPGHAREARGDLVVVSGSETRVDLRLQEEGRLRVTVLGFGAIPLEGATVEVLDAFGRRVWPGREDASVYRPYGVDWTTDGQGEVLVTRLPAGIHVVRARYPGLKPFSLRVLVQGSAEVRSALVLLQD